MPVYSMTGYASAQSSGSDAANGAGTRLGLEIRSVNSRFLDLSFRLSDELRASEPALRDVLIRRLTRGKVEVRAFVSQDAVATSVAPPAGALQRLLQAQDMVLAWLPGAAPLSVAEVLRLANADTPAASENHPALGNQLIALAEQALDAFIASREREGSRMVQMLQERIAQLRSLAHTALPLVPALVAQQQQKFLDRFAQALCAADPGATLAQAAQDRALMEATAYAIRIDVSEELNRLVAHIDEIDLLIATDTSSKKATKAPKSSELGKRLDFVIQELHREANTLGSKSSSLELTRVSVDMKVLIEQMREQVQNIE